MADEWKVVKEAPLTADDEWTVAKETKIPTTGEAVARGAGLGVRDVIEGATALPGMALDAVTWPFRAGLRAAGVPVTAPSDLKTAALDATGLPKPETPGEELRSAAVRGGTAALSTAGVGAIPAVARTAPVLTNALAGGLPSQVVGGMTGSAAGEATRQAGGDPALQTTASLLGGAAGAGATQLAGRVVSPVRAAIPQERQTLVDAARREGISLTPGEETGDSVLKNLEQSFAQLPGTSGREAARSRGTQLQFNEAMLRKGGQPGNIADPDAVKSALADVGGTIGNIADRNIMAVFPRVNQALTDMEARLSGVPVDTERVMRSKINDVRKVMIPVNIEGAGAPVAAIPGPSYRMQDTAIGTAIRNTDNADTKGMLIELRKLMRGAMDDSISPDDAEAWQTARRHYANLKVIQDAVGGAGEKAALGHIPPLAVRGALERSLSKGDYATGMGDTNQLARIGQSLLRPPPDPGTATRGAMMRVLQGGAPAATAATGYALGGPIGAVAGAAVPFVLPRAVQAFYYSPAGQAYLRNQLASGLDTNLSSIAAAGLASEAARNKLGPGN